MTQNRTTRVSANISHRPGAVIAAPADDDANADLLAWNHLLANRPRRPLPEYPDAQRLLELSLSHLTELIVGSLIDRRAGSEPDDLLLLKVAMVRLLDECEHLTREMKQSRTVDLG